MTRSLLHPSGMTRRTSAAFLGILLVLAGVVFCRTAWVCDDAYITLRTVDHFVSGHGLRYNVAERVQAFTHPLWLFCETVPFALTRDPFHSAVFLSLALSLATVALLLSAFRARPATALFAFVLLLTSRSFVDYSTGGLENPLTHLLLLVFLLRLGPEAPDKRGLLWLGALAGLATWNRMDTALLFAPGLAWAVFAPRAGGRGWSFDRRRVLYAAAGFAPFVLWEIFATFYYGFPYPNTAVAKLQSGVGALPLLRQGVWYLANSLRQDPTTLCMIAVSLAAVAVRRRRWEISAGLGILLYVFYVVKIGGDFMSGRLLSPPFLAAVVLLSRLEPFPVAWGRPALAGAALGLSLLAPYRSYTSGSDFGLFTGEIIDAHGIADERRYYFGWAGWLNGDPTPVRPIAAATRDGREARRGHVPLIVEGAIGVTGYYGGPDLHLVDCHGLAEPFLARLPAVQRDVNYEIFLRGVTGHTPTEGWRIGHFLRNVPPGYLTTLLTGENRIEDPALARFYDRIALVTRGPLWSGRRLAEVLRFNLGSGAPAGRARPEYVSIDWGEPLRVRPGVADYYYRNGMNLFRKGKTERAEEMMRQAVQLDPANGSAWSVLGVLCKQKGDAEGMLSFWRKAIEVDPEVTGVYSQLGDYMMGARQYGRAVELYKRALQVDPSSVQLYNSVGSAYSMMGDDRQAIPWLEKAVRYSPDDPEAWDNLGQSRLARDDLPGAEKAFLESVRLHEDDTNLLHAAIALANQGKDEEATRLLRRALAKNPENAEACFYLGSLLADHGGESEAVAYWTKAARAGFGPAQDALRQKGLAW